MKKLSYKYEKKFDVSGVTMAIFTRAVNHTGNIEFEYRKNEAINLSLTMVQCCKDAVQFCYNHLSITQDEYNRACEFYDEVKEKISKL